MVRVQDEITIRGPIDKVFRCFWDAEFGQFLRRTSSGLR